MSLDSIVRVDNVSKRFVVNVDKSIKERILGVGRGAERRSSFWALSDVSLDVEPGTTVGLVGHNGSGKSTLLKVIGGIIEPTSGAVYRRGRFAALLELGAGFHADLTGRENVWLNASLLGLNRQETARYFDAIVDFSGIEQFIDTQVKFYSSGMYVRLAFAIAVHVDPDLLLVDEVLAVGDEPFQRKCMDKIAQFQAEGRTIVLVSHAAEQVARLCNRVAVLDHGQLAYDGDADAGLRELRTLYGRQSPRGGDSARASVARIGEVTARVRAGSHDTTTVTLDFTVEASEPLPEWGIAVGIDSSFGTRLFSMDTFASRTVLPRSEGSHAVSLELGDLGLGAGAYSVTVGLGSPTGATFDRLANAARFEVAPQPVGRGFVRATPRITVDGKKVTLP